RAGDPAMLAKQLRAVRQIGSTQANLYKHHVELAFYVPAMAAEMDRLDGALNRGQKEIETSLNELPKLLEENEQGSLAKVTAAWADYQKAAAEIRRLARIDSNNRSAELSLGQAFQLVEVCNQQMEALMQHFNAELQADVNQCQEAGSTATWRMLS